VPPRAHFDIDAVLEKGDDCIMLKAFRFPSKSSDRVCYVAVIDTETRETWCVCPGFYHSGTTCRHVEVLQQRQDKKVKRATKKS
jgi:hypothetical protein